MIKKILAILLLVMSSSVHAEQEIITGFEDRDLPVVNEEIRRLNQTTQNNLETVTDSITTVSNQIKFIQGVYTQTGAVSTTTTTITDDDSIPQNTEGVELLTAAITPTSTTDRLKFSGSFNVSVDASSFVGICLFQDSNANALACSQEFVATNAQSQIPFAHNMAAGTTSVTTFKIRLGTDGGATLTVNGRGGGRKYGGVMSSNLQVIEYEP